MSATRLDAAPLGPFVATPAAAPNDPQLIAVGGKTNNLTVATKGRIGGSSAMTFVHGGYTGQVSGSTTTGAAQTDSFNSASGSVGVAGSPSGAVTLGVTQATAAGSHTVSLKVASAGTADDLTVGSNGTVGFTHKGGATAVALTLSAVGAHALPQTLTTKSVNIGPGQGLSITGISWNRIGTTVTVHLGGRTIKLRATARGTSAATIAHLSATSAPKHKVRLAITATLPKLPAGSQVEMVWLVHRGRHLVATHHVDVVSLSRRQHLSWTTRLKKGQHLTFTAVAVTIAVHGTAESGAARSRSKAFHVT
jgi:hypothetical protein